MTIHNPAIHGTIQGPTIHAHMIRGRIARRVITTIQERITTMARSLAIEAFGIGTGIN
jgi:hypothetical protein